MNWWEEFQEWYLDILCKHQDALSIDRYDLGLAKDFKHKIHLKTQIQFTGSSSKSRRHTSNSSNISWMNGWNWGSLRELIHYITHPFSAFQRNKAKDYIQDFRKLNQNSHIDKYSIKEITECIGDIGRADSTIFTTLDLTSGLWQMQLDEDSQKLTAFTIPGKGQFHCITSPMGLLGCLASFQRHMEGVLHDISNVLFYIDDLLVHTDTHEKHLKVLDKFWHAFTRTISRSTL